MRWSRQAGRFQMGQNRLPPHSGNGTSSESGPQMNAPSSLGNAVVDSDAEIEKGRLIRFILMEQASRCTSSRS